MASNMGSPAQASGYMCTTRQTPRAAKPFSNELTEKLKHVTLKNIPKYILIELMKRLNVRAACSDNWDVLASDFHFSIDDILFIKSLDQPHAKHFLDEIIIRPDITVYDLWTVFKEHNRYDLAKFIEDNSKKILTFVGFNRKITQQNGCITRHNMQRYITQSTTGISVCLPDEFSSGKGERIFLLSSYEKKIEGIADSLAAVLHQQNYDVLIPHTIKELCHGYNEKMSIIRSTLQNVDAVIVIWTTSLQQKMVKFEGEQGECSHLLDGICFQLLDLVLTDPLYYNRILNLYPSSERPNVKWKSRLEQGQCFHLKQMGKDVIMPHGLMERVQLLHQNLKIRRSIIQQPIGYH